MTMTATAMPGGEGFAHRVEVNGRHTITTDEPLSVGGTDIGPAPHELLAAALASCAATMVAMYARHRGWEIGSSGVAVTYDPESTPRRVTVELQLADGLSPRQLRRLEQVARSCPVRQALEAGFTFQESIRVLDGDERAAA
jgi:putative redox protein